MCDSETLDQLLVCTIQVGLLTVFVKYCEKAGSSSAAHRLDCKNAL